MFIDNSNMFCRLRRAAIPPGFEAEFTACVLCNQRFKELCEACGTARPAAPRNNADNAAARGACGRGSHAPGPRDRGVDALCWHC